MKKWFNFKYEVIFLQRYGPRQICTGKMATVIGIFEDCYLKNKPLPVVRPGSQERRFTHIKDTISICFRPGKKISVNTTVFRIKKVFLFLMWQNYLIQK